MAQVTVGQYLLERISQVGARSIFGVPGDFTLAFLDDIDKHPKLKWVGCCNELNASYAADGYARTSQNLGVLCTTFGVGELSAVNGIAGAFAERVPILHIVGVPSTKLQAHKALLHHTLGDGRFDAYIAIASHVTAAQALLMSTDTNSNGRSAAEEIDRVITIALTQRRPVYLTLPTDLAFAKISAKNLEIPINVESVQRELIQKSLPDGLLSHVVDRVMDLYKSARRPIILIDACAVRYKVQGLVKTLVEKTGLPFFTTPMGKTSLDEDHPQFSGTYIGSNTVPEVKEAVESADLIFLIGSLKSDFNTGSFSYSIKEAQSIECHSDYAQIADGQQQYARFDDLGFHVLLPALIEALANVEPAGRPDIVAGAGLQRALSRSTKPGLVQDEFWPMVVNGLRKNDVLVTETGTSNFGILDIQLPSGVTLMNQVLYGSIGWAGGAIVGAAVAAEEQGRHAVLFTGEGSYQLTLQDTAQLLRLKLTPTLYILNNKGYTIERFIHGMNAEYNDIPQFQWQKTLDYFGAQPGQSRSYSVSTPTELLNLLGDKKFQARDVIQFVEVHLPADDAPRALRVQAELSAKANAE